MRRVKLAVLFVAAFSFLFSGGGSTHLVHAAKKKHHAVKVAKKVEGVSEKEKKLLGWTSEYPTAWTYTTPDFFIRGTVINFKRIPNSKEWEITVLPIEVLNNPMHHITLEHYKKGITLRIELQPAEMRALKAGGVIEYNQYSKELPSEDTGHAKLIKSEIHTEFKPYDVAPVAYLAKPGLEVEQVVNAIQGVLIYRGNVEKNEAVKNSLATLTKNSDPTVSEKAKQCSAKLFGQ